MEKVILAKPNEPPVQFHYFKYQSVHVGDTGCTPAFVTGLISGADITQGAFNFSHFSPLKISGVKCAFQPNEPKPSVTSMPFFRELVPKGHVQRKKNTTVEGNQHVLAKTSVKGCFVFAHKEMKKANKGFNLFYDSPC